MTWLHQHGVCSNYDDYRRLPLGVLEDAIAWSEAEAAARKREENRRAANQPRGYPRARHR